MKSSFTIVLLAIFLLWFSPLTTIAQTSPQDQEALENALFLLGSEHGDRMNGVRWLAEHPQISREPIRHFLRTSSSDYQKEAALEALVQMPAVEDLPFLDSLIASTPPTNMYWLMRAIAAIPSPAAFEHLVKYAASEEKSMSGDAIVAIGYNKDTRARPFLEECLHSPSTLKRWKAGHALLMMGPTASKKALQTQLSLEKDHEVAAKLGEALQAAGK